MKGRRRPPGDGTKRPVLGDRGLPAKKPKQRDIESSFLCARDAALAHPDNKLSGPPEEDPRSEIALPGIPSMRKLEGLPRTR